MRSNILDMLNSMSGTDRLPQDLHDEMARTEMIKQKMEQLNRRTYGFGKAPVSPAVSPAQALMGQERQYAGDMSRKYGVDVLPVTESWADSTNTLPVQAGGRTMLMGRNGGTPASGDQRSFPEWKAQQDLIKSLSGQLGVEPPGQKPMTPEFRDRRQAMAASVAADAERKRAATGGVSEADRWNNVQARAKAKQDRTMPEGMMDMLMGGPQYAASMAKIRAEGEIAAGGDRTRREIAEGTNKTQLDIESKRAEAEARELAWRMGPTHPLAIEAKTRAEEARAKAESDRLDREMQERQWKETAPAREAKVDQDKAAAELARAEALTLVAKSGGKSLTLKEAMDSKPDGVTIREWVKQIESAGGSVQGTNTSAGSSPGGPQSPGVEDAAFQQKDFLGSTLANALGITDDMPQHEIGQIIYENKDRLKPAELAEVAAYLKAKRYGQDREWGGSLSLMNPFNTPYDRDVNHLATSLGEAAPGFENDALQAWLTARQGLRPGTRRVGPKRTN